MDKWIAWLRTVLLKERSPGRLWTVTDVSDVARVSRATLHAILKNQRQKLNREVLWKLAAFAEQVSVPLPVDARVTALGQVQRPSNRGLVGMVAHEVGKAIEQVIRQDEADGTTDGRAAVAAALTAFARELRTRRAADTTDLTLLADDIREGRLK